MSLKNKKRIEQRPAVAIPVDFPKDMHPVLARVFATRNIHSAAELEYGLEHLLPWDTLLGVEDALTLLTDALALQQRILIVGDFDADGATSTAVAIRALSMMGAQHLDFLVPNRFEYGYGLTPEIVHVAAKRKPELIITVDNGISSVQGVRAAKEAGIRVLVTDHHLPGRELPNADAIVNPNQPGDDFASKNLAGVGVIFYLMLALRSRLRTNNWFEQQGKAEPNLAQLLDLVALGTVADVVPLDYNNRILVAQGLARIRAGKGSAGINALIQVAGRDKNRLVSTDLGFTVGPRLNAAGRLDDMSLGIQCLLSDSPREASDIAEELDQLNKTRREIEADMSEQAMTVLQQMQLDEGDSLPLGLCLYDPQWHQGVIGILASRIKDRVHRPVIVFTDSGDGEIKGSARSITGLHLRDTLDHVAATHPGLLSRFGGHAMAAGLSLKKQDFEDFSVAFNREVENQLGTSELEDTVISDGVLTADEARLELAETLRYAAPWGQHFPMPVFEGTFELVQQRVVGEKHLKMLLRWPGTTDTIDAIAFNVDLQNQPVNDKQLHLAYKADVNEYQGRRSVQLLVEYMEALD